MKTVPTRQAKLNDLLEALLNEEVYRTTLPNGMVLIVKPDDSAPLASVQLLVRTGSIHEEQSPGAGVSHFLEHMLFKGTSRRTEQEISREVQKHGGTSNAYTTFDHTAYHIDLPAMHTSVAVDILGDMVFESLLDPEETLREQEVIQREIAMYEDDPYSRMGQVLFETSFREHPFRYPIIGYKEIFSGVTREELNTYYRSRYAPNNAVLVIVGDVDPEETREQVEEKLGSRPRGRIAPSLINGEPRQFGKRTSFLYDEVEVSRQALAFKVPGMEHPDSPGLQILSGLLGEGRSSFLWKTLRDGEGLVHEVSASLWNPAQLGLLLVDFMADPAKREAAAISLERNLQEFLREPPATERLEKFLRQSLARLIAQRKSMAGQAGALGRYEVSFGDLEFPRLWLRSLAAVTPEQVLELGRRYIQPDQCSVVALDPLTRRPARVTRQSRNGEARLFNREDLPNGVTLLWQEDHRLPTVVGQAVMRGGLVLDGPQRAGASAMVARLLTKDTAHRSAADVEELTENASIQLRASSGQTFLSLGVESRPSDWAQALELWGDALTCPRFAEASFARERAAAQADFQEEMEDPREDAIYRFRRAFWGPSHPLAGWPDGNVESLAALEKADLQAHFESMATGANLVVALNGDFDPETDLPVIRKRLEAIPRGEPVDISRYAVDRPESVSGTLLRETKSCEQEVVLQGYPFVGVTDPRTRLEVEVLNEIFNGMSSRLFDEVRNQRGLAYYVGSTPSYGYDEGLYLFYAGTAPGKGEEVLAVVQEEIQRLREGQIDDEEWERCLNFTRSKYYMRSQSLNHRTAQAAMHTLAGFDPNASGETLDQLARLSRDSITDLVQTFLVPENGLSFILSPT